MPQPAMDRDSVPQRAEWSSFVEKWLKMAGLAYAIGFLVIMTHTSRLHVPIVDALHFQNVIAGLPVCLALLLGYWLSRLVARRFQRPSDGMPKTNGEPKTDGKPKINRIGLLILAVCSLIAASILYAELQVLLDWRLSFFQKVAVLVGCLLVAIFSMLVQMLRSEKFKVARETGVVLLSLMYAGILGLVWVYAYFVYPHVSQSVGGGRQVRVKLMLKDSELRGVLGGPATVGGPPENTADVTLFYRTTTYLLVSRAEDQPLIQVPTDHVLAIIWLESRGR